MTSAGVTEAGPLPAQGKEQRIKVPQDGNPEKMTHGLTLLEPIFLHLVETGPAAPAPAVESCQAAGPGQVGVGHQLLPTPTSQLGSEGERTHPHPGWPAPSEVGPAPNRSTSV